ncbi:AT-hook motif nuclear-localized protein 8 [Arabidopsis thaliana]|nr:PPC domain [Arabidopsis thaliana x Arabidopsis arenosa]
MDSRDIPPSHNQLQPPPGMLMSHYRNPNAAASPLMVPTSTSQPIQHPRLPFGNQQQSQTFHQQQQQQMDQKTLESLGFGDGSPSSQPMRFGIDDQNQQLQVKKKRGRPRKYTPDGSIALGLAPTSPLLSAASNSYGEGGVGDSGGNGNSVDPPVKRNRGRPPGSSKKQLDALGGTSGVGFTPHVIEVNTGEDIASKVMAFSDQGSRTICILSASGAVSRVMLRQASHSSGIVTYEGRFEIITLSGSVLNYEVNGSTNRSGNLSVALAGPDGGIVGGSVVGNLVAATQVQVIVGSFVAEAKKPKQSNVNIARGQNPEPASAPANMLNFGSVSQGPSSESSEENESGSPAMHRDNNNGIYGAQQQQQQQPLHPHQMQMYQHLWSNHGQ